MTKGNALTKAAATVPAAVQSLRAAGARLRAAAEGARTGGGADPDGAQFLNYSGKLRRYNLGSDKAEIDREREFILDPFTYIEGWICWKNSKVVGQHEWYPVTGDGRVVEFEELADHGPYTEDNDGWSPLCGFRAVAADDPSFKVKFTTNSKSGVNSTSDFVKEAAARLSPEPSRDNPDPLPEPYYPLFTFDDEVFEAKGKMNGKPVFRVNEWLEPIEALAVFDGAADIDVILDEEDPWTPPQELLDKYADDPGLAGQAVQLYVALNGGDEPAEEEPAEEEQAEEEPKTGRRRVSAKSEAPSTATQKGRQGRTAKAEAPEPVKTSRRSRRG